MFKYKTAQIEFVPNLLKRKYTIMAAAIILYDLALTYISITFYGMVETNPLYYILTPAGFFILNVFLIFAVYLFESGFGGVSEWKIYWRILEVVLIFRFVLVTSMAAVAYYAYIVLNYL